MAKAIRLALFLTITSAAVTAFGGVTTEPDHLWEAQQKVKDLQAQVESLQGQVAQLQLQVSSLQTENGALKAKLEEKDEELRAAATQPIKLTPEAINPPDLLKDYPQDRMPAYGDATNNLRIQALNQYLMGKFAGKPVIITGKFQSATASGMRGFTVTVLPPVPTTMPRWTVTATFPVSATDEILKLKRDDTVTFSGTISRIAYATPNARYTSLAIFLKDAAIAK
ncbi:MAG: hypothetical protein ACTHN5_11480 [Phycisphaerae bacterium]